MESERGRRWSALCVGLLILIFGGTLTEVALTLRLVAKAGASLASRSTVQALPCAAVPTKLILEDPVCADKLLRAMNVTNVRILPRGASIPGFDENGTARMRKLMMEYTERANGTRRA